MNTKSSTKNTILGIIILCCLLVYAVAAIIAAFKLAAWLGQRGFLVFLGVHVAVIISGLLWWLLPEGWWTWVVGFPCGAWLAVVAVMALGEFWDMASGWIRRLTGAGAEAE